MAGLITEVVAGSIGAELQIAPGDELLTINGNPLEDIIDYRYHVSEEEELVLEVRKPNGQIWQYEIEKDINEDIGLGFTANVFDGIRFCHNHCLFCFMDQLQPNPRPSLKIKDDDYRMSFLAGNYITCINLTENDFARIGRLRLSPLYISVHSTNPYLRSRLMGNSRATNIMEQLDRLYQMRITFHTQIVLCPGMNDGEELKSTIKDLVTFYNEGYGLASIAVVPVGLTKYQKNHELRLYTPEEAGEIIDFIDIQGEEFRYRFGKRLLFAADEFYLRAGRNLPDIDFYEDFSQTENGVGMARLFLSQWQSVKANITPNRIMPSTGIVTGLSGAIVFNEIMKDLAEYRGMQVKLLPVANTFYGENVTVVGLLTGSCLVEALKGKHNCGRLLIPATMLKFDEEIFLDGMTLNEVREQLGTEIIVVPANGVELYRALFT
jgi:putative radical SAM enzyme (TIGR03279 family)